MSSSSATLSTAGQAAPASSTLSNSRSGESNHETRKASYDPFRDGTVRRNGHHAVVSTLVTVANTAASPVITQAGDNRARTAVALQCIADGAVGFQQADCSLGTAKAGAGAFQVPAGQRLVIE